ncbi:hypothetical protein FEZ51_00175 [Pediococcus stilesii]|uniref:Uncharacterized protein n=1 Tax=Pediococcus stilesii TaxID=331679 RepID=A0A5R9BYS7_9LACO|nr:hypothetical protein [Pediococcus stilesii]TLQ05635.1 hypothetical protein FEZ51_00175 [Pediococcus stilesii]
MARGLSQALRSLLVAMNLGRSQNHPLAGWTLLSMLYRDGSTASEPMTMNYLVDRYNGEYLEPGENRVASETLRSVMKVLVEQAHLVTSSTRRVRERMNSGKFHMIQSAIYRINAAGIEYLKAMQRVIDAENTVVASTKRIGEYVALIDKFQNFQSLPADTMTLYENFNRLLEVYDAVMNGLRKLDVDLHDISTDLAFDRVSDAAMHLRKMLHDEAIPAYSQMMQSSGRLQWLQGQPNFAPMVAKSRQSAGNLDVNVAIGDQAALEVERRQTETFVTRRLSMMVQSFDPTTAMIQTSFDSIYLLYSTLVDATELLAREYEHVHSHSIDLQALTEDIDTLLIQVHRIKLPEQFSVHLPMDRLSKIEMKQIENLPKDERAEKMAEMTETVRNDMLEAGSMDPVTRSVITIEPKLVTAADNPEVAEDDDLAGDERTALTEFTQLVMESPNIARIDHDLECQTSLARDAIIGLYPATQYDQTETFSAFGRPIHRAKLLADRPVRVHLDGEQFAVILPHAFTVTFGQGGMSDG